MPVGPDSDADAVMRTVGEIAKVVRGDGGGGRRSFSTGVSRPITSAADLPAAYDEALKAVHVGRQMHGESALTHFDGLGIYRLLALIPDGADLRRFVEESLGELATDDSPENADLRHTLSVLIDTNLNVAETARQLFFHYNTLRYRIAKLERMLGPFTSDPQLRLTLALALRDPADARHLTRRTSQRIWSDASHRQRSPSQRNRSGATVKVEGSGGRKLCRTKRHPAVNDC